MTRTKAADLSDEAAFAVFSSGVPIGSSPKSLWPYFHKDGTTRPGVQWPAVEKLKHVISDVLDASGGRCLKQVRFTKQLNQFLLKNAIMWTPTEVSHGLPLTVGCLPRLNITFLKRNDWQGRCLRSKA